MASSSSYLTPTPPTTVSLYHIQPVVPATPRRRPPRLKASAPPINGDGGNSDEKDALTYRGEPSSITTIPGRSVSKGPEVAIRHAPSRAALRRAALGPLASPRSPPPPLFLKKPPVTQSIDVLYDSEARCYVYNTVAFMDVWMEAKKPTMAANELFYFVIMPANRHRSSISLNSYEATATGSTIFPAVGDTITVKSSDPLDHMNGWKYEITNASSLATPHHSRATGWVCLKRKK